MKKDYIVYIHENNNYVLQIVLVSKSLVKKVLSNIYLVCLRKSLIQETLTLSTHADNSKFFVLPI